MRQLQTNLGGGVTVDSVIAAPLEDVQALIKPVTFYTQKAKYVSPPSSKSYKTRTSLIAWNRNIKRVAEILRTQYRGDIPSTYKGTRPVLPPIRPPNDIVTPHSFLFPPKD
jgi:hypothetical protein